MTDEAKALVEKLRELRLYVLGRLDRKARERYFRHICPRCLSHGMSWIPEAPGSVSGKACRNCRKVWTDEIYPFRGSVSKHPYAALAGDSHDQ